MTSTLYLLTICLPLAAVILIFAMRAFASVQQARARLANDDAYRRIAETSATAQSDNATALAAIQAALGDVRTRLASVETILKDVG